jgi:hypothetical protein
MKSNLSKGDIERLSKELFDDVLEVLDDGMELHGFDYFEGHSLGSVWHATQRVGDDFEKRRNAFLWILHRLLREDRIKLHKRGTFLGASIDEQTEMFQKAFPESEEDADKKCTKPGYEAAYEGFGMNVWWFLDICPAGVAWRQPDGSYQIAD